MNKIKDNNAITLIALVLTIIVLLILSGISITMLTGQNGILNRAQEAKEKTELAQKDEEKNLQGYQDIIDQNTENLPSRNETKPYFPDSTFSYKEGNLDTGLVIKDSEENEFVWVEVPKTINVYATAGLGITNFTDEEYTKIEADLKEYTKDYKNDYCSDTNSTFTELYQNMLKSIYTNGGFWIGRYEVGIDGDVARTSHIDITSDDRAVVKQNKIPYNYVTRDEAQKLATRMNYEECTSSLIFGVQWDLTLKHIENKIMEKNDNSDIKTKLTSNSTTIGNYNNNLWNIANANVKYSIDNGSSFDVCIYQKKSKSNVLLTTGADEDFLLMNIYDIAGNVWEWTLEFYTTSYPCVSRGGSYSSDGLEYPAKQPNGVADSSNHAIGFRIGLWK